MVSVLIGLILTVLLLIFIITVSSLQDIVYSNQSFEASFQFHYLPSLLKDYLNNLSISII